MTPARIGPDSLFVVSGGGRGITAACVVALAQSYGCRFLLLGRSESQPEPEWAHGCVDDAQLKQRAAAELRRLGLQPAPAEIARLARDVTSAREVEQTLRAVSTAGGQAQYASVDITDRHSLQAVLDKARSRLGAFSGLIHGAGALADKPIERKTMLDFDMVYSTKVTGLENLLGCLDAESLRHVILFASAAGFFGNPGQCDYALSNEILNRVAHRLRHAHPACRVIAFNWGPWDGGMVTPALKERFAERGVDIIPVGAGTSALLRVLENQDSPVHVLVGGRLPTEPPRLSGGPRVRRVTRQLTVDANPFLADHNVGGRAVLPMVCAVGWLANAGEQLYPGLRFFKLEDFQVLKGIVFDEQLASTFRLELVERENTDDTVCLEALISSQDGSAAQRYHYRGTLTLTGRPTPPQKCEMDLREDGSARSGASLYADGTLFHGPAFRGIERLLNADERRVTLRCRLPALNPEAQGQFPVQSFNAFGADVQFQSLVIWARLLRGSASLPLSAGSGESFRLLPFDQVFYVTTTIRSASDHQVLADIDACDESGAVYTRVRGASVILSDALNDKFKPQPAA